MKSPLELLQPLGRALMLPIAVLPIAGLLLRFGQPDILGAWHVTAAIAPFVGAAGDAIFSNLGLLFAIGVGVGLARDNNGAAGLAGVVCYLIATHGAQALLHAPPDALKDISGDAAKLAEAAFKDKATAKLSVPIGILSGVIAGNCYNRFSNFRLPDYLAFFGGRRFVPIISGLCGLVVAAAVGFGYAALNGAVDSASHAIVGSGDVGLFVYGVLNRLLIVTGLHHILNNVAWFVIGDFHGATGDLNRFFKGDPTAGAFMSGFFPVMMFGLPAACLAMYHAAPKERRPAVGGMLLSMAATAFLTGVTEPIEFTFMFLAPALYAIHAVLTGASMVIMHLLGAHLGFGFSAGLFDYALNWKLATKPWLLLPVGLVYFAVYYGVFRAAIRLWDLKTPGREPETEAASVAGRLPATAARPLKFIAALGGTGNLTSVDACTTRLRLIVVDQAKVDEAALKALGAKGIVRPSANALQVVLGPIADQIASEIREALRATDQFLDGLEALAQEGPEAALSTAADLVVDRRAWLEALGGAGNVRRLEARAGRLRVEVADETAVREEALTALGARGVARLAGALHILIGPDADAVGAALA